MKIILKGKVGLCERCGRGAVLTYQGGQRVIHCHKFEKVMKDIPFTCSGYDFRWGPEDELEWEKRNGVYIIKPTTKTYGTYL